MFPEDPSKQDLDSILNEEQNETSDIDIEEEEEMEEEGQDTEEVEFDQESQHQDDCNEYDLSYNSNEQNTPSMQSPPEIFTTSMDLDEAHISGNIVIEDVLEDVQALPESEELDELQASADFTTRADLPKTKSPVYSPQRVSQQSSAVCSPGDKSPRASEILKVASPMPVKSQGSVQYDSRSPIHSNSPALMKTPTPIRSPSPAPLESPHSTPVRIPSPAHIDEKSSPAPIRISSPTPVRSTSSAQMKSTSPTPIRSTSPAQMKSTSPTPIRSTSPAQMKSASPTPIRSTSPAQMKSSSPTPIRSTSPAQMKSSSSISAHKVPIRISETDILSKDAIEINTGVKTDKFSTPARVKVSAVAQEIYETSTKKPQTAIGPVSKNSSVDISKIQLEPTVKSPVNPLQIPLSQPLVANAPVLANSSERVAVLPNSELIANTKSPSKKVKENSPSARIISDLLKTIGMPSTTDISSIIDSENRNPVLQIIFKKCSDIFTLSESGSSDPSALRSHIHTLKTNHLKKEAAFDQQIHELDNRVHALETQLEVSKTKNERQHQILETQSTQILMLKNDIREKEIAIHSFSQKEQQSVSNSYEFEEERRKLTNLVKKQREEITQISDEFEYSKKQADSLRAEVANSNGRLTESQNAELELRSNLVSCQQELTQTKKMVEWCNAELERKNTQFGEYRKTKNDQVSRLQLSCETLAQEKSVAESKSQILQKRSDELEMKIQQTLENLRECENREALAFQQFKHEMGNQKKLTELYQSKSLELETIVTDLNSQLIQTKDQAEIELHEIGTQLEESKAVCKRLDNELLSVRLELESKSPHNGQPEAHENSSFASQAIRNGKTFTEIYSEYSLIKSELISAKAENKRLSDYLVEFQRSAAAIEQIQLNLEESRQENDTLLKSIETQNLTIRKLEYSKTQMDVLEKEKILLQKDVRDMSRQIQHLLRQIEHLSPGSSSRIVSENIINRLSQNLDEGIGADASLSPAEALIEERLVVFRNIEELHTQNQALRRSLRSLSAQMEAHQSENLKDVEEKHTKDIVEATKIIEDLQEELKVKNLQTQSMLRERDQWKQIAESRNTRTPRSSPVPSHFDQSPPRALEQNYRALQVTKS
jgi:hypothetical protein